MADRVSSYQRGVDLAGAAAVREMAVNELMKRGVSTSAAITLAKAHPPVSGDLSALRAWVTDVQRQADNGLEELLAKERLEAPLFLGDSPTVKLAREVLEERGEHRLADLCGALAA